MSIEDLISKQIDAINTNLENWLLEYFGTRENAEKNAKDYVLEIMPGEVKYQDWDQERNESHLSLWVDYRIRPKTEDEKRSERVEGILKKNSTQGTCISCGEDILGDEDLVATIHGDYHGPPKTCLNGRD